MKPDVCAAVSIRFILEITQEFHIFWIQERLVSAPRSAPLPGARCAAKDAGRWSPATPGASSRPPFFVISNDGTEHTLGVFFNG